MSEVIASTINVSSHAVKHKLPTTSLLPPISLNRINLTSSYTLTCLTFIYHRRCLFQLIAITRQPMVECGREFIRFSVKTMKPFRGKVFVKGQHRNNDCSRNYSGANSIHAYHPEETMVNNSEQKGNDSFEERSETSPPSQSSIESTPKITSIMDESGSSEAFTIAAATVHGEKDVKQMEIEKKNYIHSIGDRAMIAAPHCPPCPVCGEDKLKVDKQQVDTENTADLLIRLGTCNAQYEQQTEPRAMIISLTVVVSFHQNLLTKLDRAFRIQCAYMEGSKTIDADLSVSMPPSIEVESKMNPPQCIYTVNSPSGKVITNARVGDIVEHHWVCRSPFKDFLELKASLGVHAMLVKNCYAESNDNFRVLIIDENGCTLDPYILPNLQYAQDLLSVKIRAPVFKFPDRSDIGFRCDVFVCLRGQQDCELITIKCTKPKF
uniref:ZP domain-containing protein n=1 Tax=Elaeophora elaphi TaxID=1147741 RepID=A0A0R3RZA7_9BILA